jgi:hypothetical protein
MIGRRFAVAGRFKMRISRKLAKAGTIKAGPGI